jgi:ferredoxin-thioredoxin reductase catalytic chain
VEEVSTIHLEESVMTQPTTKSRERIQRLVDLYTSKTGTTTHPDGEITEIVILGLASHLDQLKKPLCPCRFYPDKKEEIKHRTWICPCDDMQIYKYCHCLLFVRDDGHPITEYLPEHHEGRQIWGEVADPTPDQGRPLKHRAEERERERKERHS